MPTTTARKRASGAKRPGISRIDQESTRTHGYFARFGYARDKSGTWRPKHRAFFGDASHGSKKKALAAAEAWLGKIERAEKRAGGAAKAPAKAAARPAAAKKKAVKKATKKAAKKK
jgi:hypothetical protein